MSFLGQATNFVAGTVANAANVAGTNVGNVSRTVANTAGTVANAAGTTLANATGTVANVANVAGSTVVNTVGTVANVAGTTVATTVGAVAHATGAGADEATTTVANATVTTVTNVVGTIVNVTGTMVANVVGTTLANVPIPTATLAGVDLDLGLDGITLIVKVSVSNPYPLPIPIGDIVYAVKSDGNVVVSGMIPDPGSLRANDNTMLDVKVKIPHNAVVSLVKDISRDWDVDYVLELGLVVDLPLIGSITIPVWYTGTMKLPTIFDLFPARREPWSWLGCLDCGCVSYIWAQVNNMIIKEKHV